eukprot:2564165-Amphidinium_carterae.1
MVLNAGWGDARRGYWGNRIGFPHTVPMKVHGKCGSVRVRLIPAPRGTGVTAERSSGSYPLPIPSWGPIIPPNT